MGSDEARIELKVYDNGDHTCLVWQSGHLRGEDLAEIEFWLGNNGTSKPAASRVRAVSSA